MSDDDLSWSRSGQGAACACHELIMNGLWRAAAGALVVAALALTGADQRSARGEEPAASAAKPVRQGCQRSGFRVVVDVGHTREVPGAISARGSPEYAFNLQLAGAIRQALVDAGFSKTVLMVTATAPLLGLAERAMRANTMKADLFLSIHHDSVPEYLLETWNYGGQENHFSDRFKGFAIFISKDNPERDGSLQFGRLLGKALHARGLRYTPHYTLPIMGNRRRELLDPLAGVYSYDQLIVLQQTHMPAVLLEAGSIVNRQEEVELTTPERRSAVGAAVAAAVADFCAARMRHGGTVLVRRAPSRGAAAQPAAQPSPANPVSLSR